MSKKLLGRPDMIIRSGGNGVELISNSFRPSSASGKKTLLYGPSEEYKAEEWGLEYFSVDEDEQVTKHAVTTLLPEGYEKAYLAFGGKPVKRGPIYKVKAWGVEFACRYLEFCHEYRTVRDEKTKNAVESASWDLRAIGWELPGHFIIASDDHPFTAKSPGGREFVYDSWCRAYNAIELLREGKKNGRKEKGNGK